MALSTGSILLLQLSSWMVSAQIVVPKWPVTYQMNRSTVIMTCNSSGYFSDDTVQKLARFGIVDIDWSNAKLLWSNAQPMDDQQRLLTQAEAIKAVDPTTYVMVYRNLAKALPWYSDVREKLEDPAYNTNWFLQFKQNPPYHVPPCTNYTNSSGTFSKCSTFYHDQDQTPHYPNQCNQECDCGVNIPCGEYVWDHRNVSLQKWLGDVHIMGPSTNNGENSTGLNNPNIDGFYIDDFWTNTSSGNSMKLCNQGPYGGVSEMDYYCWQDMGLTQKDTTDLTNGWHASMDYAQQLIIENNGWSWRLFRPASSPINSTECIDFLRGRGKGLTTGAVMYEYMTLNDNENEFMIDLTIFLLVRGDYAWLGYNWNGCHDTWVYGDWNEMLDKDYGEPLGDYTEISNGVFQRKWSKATIEMNCNTYKPTITFDT